MAIYGGALTYRLPREEEVALTPELVTVIRHHHQKSREHLCHLCLIAYGLRKHNLVRAKSGAGGNAQGKVYKPEFGDWYEKNDLTDIYGVLSNFNHYASAGRLLEYVRWQIGEQYISHLPTSMSALYAASQILWEQGGKTDDTRRERFTNALMMPLRDGSKRNALIHTHVTRKEIEEWHAKQAEQPPDKRTDKTRSTPDPRTIVLATIKVHQDLNKFTKGLGKKRIGPDLLDVERLTELVRQVIERFDAGTSRYLLESHLDEVRDAYDAAKNPDFGKRILAAQREPRQSTRTSKKS